MIHSILAISPEKLDKLDCIKLSSYERKTLQEIVDMLSPFESATHFTQGEKVVTASLVVPCVKGVKKKLASLAEIYNGPLIRTLKESFHKCMTPFEERESLIIATILDPRFKLSWCSGSTHTSHKERLQELASVVEVETLGQVANTEENPVKNLKTDFIDMFLGSPQTTEIESATCKEVDDSLSQSLLNYWAINDVTDPRLATLAAKFLSVPGLISPSGENFQYWRKALPS